MYKSRAREAEEACQAAKFEADMKALEEEAAREAEIAAEKKRVEEKKLAEQKCRAEEKQKESERVARERAKALKKLAEDKRKEEDARTKVTEELAKRRELAAAAAIRCSGPPTSQSALGSQPKTKKMVKSPSQVRDELEELTEEEEEQPAPQGVKQKVMTVMAVLLILTTVTIPRQEMMVEIPPPPLPRNREPLATGVFYSTLKMNVARRRAIDAHKLAHLRGTREEGYRKEDRNGADGDVRGAQPRGGETSPSHRAIHRTNRDGYGEGCNGIGSTGRR
ncbi:hypothetical protein F5050DRAFT_1715971 [Lentinula boryana]|uniref:Uncharacterized protein n=1 Tax=Lentinula boryana TaxID=40481 RepID=A0ABQ8PYS2_9AGAR|nr:hypothetical protein F5050DRAFT_1715971 [Lentinula boryana]